MQTNPPPTIPADFFKGFVSSGDLIDEATKKLVEQAFEAGLSISEVTQSENRFHGRSNYLTIRSYYCYASVRVSDHFKNDDFRTEHIWITGFKAEDFPKQIEKAIKGLVESGKKHEAIYSEGKAIADNADFMQDYKAFLKVRVNLSEARDTARRTQLEEKYKIPAGRLNLSSFVDAIRDAEAKKDFTAQHEAARAAQRKPTFKP